MAHQMTVKTLARMVGVCAAIVAVAAPLAAQNSVLGTFTVNGKTTRFNLIYATFEAAPDDPGEKYLILLVSDVPIAPADRTPERLSALAQTGKVKVIKLRWKYGFDSIAVVPYHADIAESGRAFASMSTVNLSALDDKRVHAEFKSKMLGQTWFFNAIVKSVIATGGVAVLEPDVTTTSMAPGTAEADPTRTVDEADPAALKRSLGGMGYEYKPEAFFQAIADRNAQAVTQFLKAGMSPNQKDEQNRYALNYAVLFCAQSPEESEAVIRALVSAKADVKTKDPDNGTTALVGSVQSCSAGSVDALIKAGSDLSAKSNGGTTALQLAKIFGRAEVVAVLDKAGAR
jgi:hypothetical protein